MKTRILNKSSIFIALKELFSIDKTLYDIEKLIKNNDYKHVTLDLRNLNLIYALKIGVFTSTTQLIKNVDSDVQLIVDSIELMKYLKTLELSNCKVTLDKKKASCFSFA